jgi:phosphoribosylformylglycinamidine synthase
VVAVIRCAAAAVERGLVASAHDCADGGIAVALAECCIAARRGARLALPAARGARSDVLLFGEAIGRVVVSVPPARVPELMRLAADFRVPAHVLGVTGGDRLVIGADGEPARAPWIDADIETLARAWRGRGGAPAGADAIPAGAAPGAAG